MNSGHWKRGKSGNPRGRPPGIPADKEWFRRLRIAAHREVEVDEQGECKLKRKVGKVDQLTVVADKVFEMAREGNAWAIEHLANRFDGKVRESVEVTTNPNVKIRYESFEEARAALLAEGINVDRLPLLTDMRPREKQEQN